MSDIDDRIRILLVEDNRGDIFLIKEALTESGLLYELTVCEDGADARDFLLRSGLHADAKRPQLLLLDLNLPRVTGEELLNIVRKIPVLADMPVVILSSSNSPRDRALAVGAHHTFYITKPSDLDAYLAVGPRIRSFYEECQHA